MMLNYPSPSDLKRSLLSLTSGLGGNFIAKGLLKKNPRILMFHKVVIDSDNDTMGHISLALFTKLVAYLSQNYNLLTLRQMVENYRVHGCFDDNALAMTFDDGFVNFRDVVAPVLNAIKAPSTIFICPELVNRGETLWTEVVSRAFRRGAIRKKGGELGTVIGHLKSLPSVDRLREMKEFIDFEMPYMNDDSKVPESDLMTWSDIAELQSSGRVEIGSHTLTHPVLSKESAEQSMFEIVESKRLIENKLGTEVASFCFPFGQHGDFSQRDVDLVKSCGYQCAVTSNFGVVGAKADRFQLPRIGADFSSFPQGRKYVDGVEYFQRKLFGD